MIVKVVICPQHVYIHTNTIHACTYSHMHLQCAVYIYTQISINQKNIRIFQEDVAPCVQLWLSGAFMVQAEVYACRNDVAANIAVQFLGSQGTITSVQLFMGSESLCRPHNPVPRQCSQCLFSLMLCPLFPLIQYIILCTYFLPNSIYICMKDISKFIVPNVH